MSFRSVSSGEQSGTAKTRSFLSPLRSVALLLELEDANRCAAKHHAGIGPGVVDHQDVERIAIRGLGRRNAPPNHTDR
jgi:hypothetical protein